MYNNTGCDLRIREDSLPGLSLSISVSDSKTRRALHPHLPPLYHSSSKKCLCNNADKTVLLADFGVAKVIPEDEEMLTGVCGTKVRR